MKTVLTIAGSDCSGGAGIQADLKTFIMNGVYGMSAVTALTAQNTTGVADILPVSPDFLKSQLDMIFTDIRPNAVKIGMVASAELIEVITDRLDVYQADNIVVDPVMVSTSGSALLENDAVQTLITKLLPMAALITPNLPEAEVLSSLHISDKADMLTAAKIIHEKTGCAVLLKGGHCLSDADDLFYDDHQSRWFTGKRIDNPNTHGTGCTLSSAIAANLAKGFSPEEAVSRAKAYLTGALSAMLNLGKGSGPVNHGFNLNGVFASMPSERSVKP